MQRRTSKKCTKALLYTKIFCVSLGYWEWGEKARPMAENRQNTKDQKIYSLFSSIKKKCFLKNKADFYVQCLHNV